MDRIVKSRIVTRRQNLLERFDSTELKEMSFVSEEKQYDEAGHLLLSITWAQPDELEEKIVKKYEANRIITEYYIEENEISEKTETEVDADGNALKEIIYYADGTESISIYEYENGLPVKKTTNDEDEISGVHIWRYDNKGNIIKEEEFEYGDLILSREITYTEDGKVKTHRTFNEGEPGFVTEEFEYQDAHVAKVIKTDAFGNTEEHMYESDVLGNVVSAQASVAGKNSSTSIKYDERGNAIHEIETGVDEEVLYEIFRTFDAESNLVLRAEAYINRQGRGPDMRYVLEYAYEFHA